ncbi:hypothetical protein [Rhodopseudomonas sp. B29]|uniref:hypothetical protein n=1 Tax=Rhodopseudomonas sp. B29 TaxID=95607 RepID=UPI0003B3DC36|nr:hypothetical protein [Rhodopseudomonas sp. B29]
MSNRGPSNHLTDEEIDRLRAAFDAGNTARGAARDLPCSAPVAAKYFERFRKGYRDPKPPAPPKFDAAAHRASRFYHSNFEL